MKWRVIVRGRGTNTFAQIGQLVPLESIEIEAEKLVCEDVRYKLLGPEFEVQPPEVEHGVQQPWKDRDTVAVFERSEVVGIMQVQGQEEDD